MPDYVKLQFKLKELVAETNLRKMYVVVSKTKSLFNRDMTELPRIQKVIRKFLIKNPEIGEYRVNILPLFPNAHYNFGTKTFGIGLFNADIISHELNHAESTENAELYKNILKGSKVISGLTSKFTYPVFLGQSLKISDPTGEMKENVNKAYDALSLAHGVASLPTMYEEGKANLNAILDSDDKLKSLRALGPAYATYFAKAAIPIGVYQLAKQDIKKLLRNE